MYWMSTTHLRACVQELERRSKEGTLCSVTRTSEVRLHNARWRLVEDTSPQRPDTVVASETRDSDGRETHWLLPASVWAALTGDDPVVDTINSTTYEPTGQGSE